MISTPDPFSFNDAFIDPITADVVVGFTNSTSNQLIIGFLNGAWNSTSITFVTP